MTGLEGEESCTWAGLSWGISRGGGGDAPAVRKGWVRYYDPFPGFLHLPHSTAEIAPQNTCTTSASQTHQLPPASLGPRPVPLSGKGHKVPLPFTSPSQPRLLRCQRRLKIKGQNNNIIIKPMNKPNQNNEFPSISFLTKQYRELAQNVPI